MSLQSSAAVAQVVATYQGATTNLQCGIATTALLLYDVLLTSGQEYRYIWRKPKGWISRIMYLCIRYMFLLNLLLNLGTIPSISDISCASLSWLTDVLYLLNLVGSSTFTTLRIYALSRANRILSGLALVVSMAPFVINASTMYPQHPSNLPASLNCTRIDIASRSLNIGLTIASRGSLILVESLVIAVTWCQIRAAIQLRTCSLKRPSTEQVMWENGAVNFLTIVSMTAVDMMLVLLSIAITPDGVSSYVLTFVDPISSVLNSRFLLRLHETNARREEADDASLSSFSLDTGSGDDPSALASPELPEFLGSIGGSIHSFHGDEDLEPLDFVPLESLNEPQSEPEGENIESGRSDVGDSIA